MARGANYVIKTYSCHVYSLKTIKRHLLPATQHFTAAKIHKAELVALLHSRYVLGTTKNNYNNFGKALILLTRSISG